MNYRRTTSLIRWNMLLVMALLSACGIAPTVYVQPAPASRDARAANKPAQKNIMEKTGKHNVVKGETLYAIAFRHGLDFRDLASWNHIDAPYTIYPGQKLNLRAATPVTKSTASVVSSSNLTQPSSVPASGTLTQIVRDDSNSVTAIPLASGERPSVQVLPTPKSQSVAPASATTVQNATTTKSSTVIAASTPARLNSQNPHLVGISGEKSNLAKPDQNITLQSSSSTSASAPALPPAVVKPNLAINPGAPSVKRDGVLWRWPLAGKLIAQFVPGDPTQQGVDLAGKLGQQVAAAADGDVVYSGNGLLGYGELVIVKHSPDYLSAYGHNQRRLVSEGDKIKAGQVIAEVGQRGGQSLLHFEIRKQGKPVDPLLYLPKR